MGDCSGASCMYTAKHATQACEKMPGAEGLPFLKDHCCVLDIFNIYLYYEMLFQGYYEMLFQSNVYLVTEPSTSPYTRFLLFYFISGK